MTWGGQRRTQILHGHSDSIRRIRYETCRSGEKSVSSKATRPFKQSKGRSNIPSTVATFPGLFQERIPSAPCPCPPEESFSPRFFMFQFNFSKVRRTHKLTNSQTHKLTDSKTHLSANPPALKGCVRLHVCRRVRRPSRQDDVTRGIPQLEPGDGVSDKRLVAVKMVLPQQLQ